MAKVLSMISAGGEKVQKAQNTPKGSRTPVTELRTRRPRPLDDGGGIKIRQTNQDCLLCINGGGGIRTPGTFQYNGFQDRRNKPLCHSSKFFILLYLQIYRSLEMFFALLLLEV